MSPSPVSAARRGETLAGRALDDTWTESVARAGLLSRAVIYTVLAALVVEVLVDGGGTEVDSRGAVETLSGAVAGRVMLVILCAGFTCYVAWQLLRAATRRRDQGSAANAGRRLLALATAMVYAAWLVTTVRVLAGSGGASQQSEQQSWTARLLVSGGGRALAALAAVIIIAAGLGFFAYALSRRFESPLDTKAMKRPMRRVAAVLGVAGQSARGLVLVIIGGFVLSAALADDASRSKGLDASLRAIAAQRFGAILLGVVALGFLAFGLYSLLDARYRKDFSR